MRLERLLAGILGSFLGMLFALPQNTHAQETATLHGTLTDPSGAAVAGAEITLQSLDSRAKTSRAQSGPDGMYVLTLAPGRYRVGIQHASFSPAEQEFHLSPGETRTWDVRLALERMSSTVVVSASAEPLPIASAAAPVTILTHEDIAERQEIWLAPMLAMTAGASFTRLGPIGGITTFFLDGGNSNFTKVLVDGTPVNQPGGDMDFSNFDLENVDKIEIVHGASSALFGSDAMSGVVQIFTHRGATKTPQLALEADGGTFGTGHGGAQLSGLLGAIDYSASASYFSTGGQGANDHFRDTALSGSFGYKFSDTDQVRLSLRSAASDAGQPGQTLLEPAILGQHGDQRNFFANLSWNFSTGEHWQHHLAGTEAYTRQFFAVPGIPNIFNQFNRAGFEEQSSYLFPNGAVSLGYVYEVENGIPDGPHVRRNNQAGYLEAHYQFGRRLSATAGARAEANASFGTRVVPRVGASYALRFGNNFWGATRLRASYGLGIKEPTLVQSFENDPCFPGNRSLDPERSNTFDAGVEQILASDRLRLSVDYFHNTYFDIVSFSFDPNPTMSCKFGTGTFFNTDRARATGSHAALEAKPTRWLRIVGNYTYDDTRVLKAPNVFDPTLAPGNRLFRRPLHSANLIFNARVWRMNWNLAGTYVGRRTDSDFLGLGITSNPSYVRWDLATMLPLRHDLSVTARVENLFDRRYQDAVGYPALGLNYRLGIKYVWGGE
jgi:outer membrane cobalamin receptor